MASTEKTAPTAQEQLLIKAINDSTHSGHYNEKAYACSYREGLVARLHEPANTYREMSIESVKKIVDEVCKGFPEHPRPNTPSDVTVTLAPPIPSALPARER